MYIVYMYIIYSIYVYVNDFLFHACSAFYHVSIYKDFYVLSCFVDCSIHVSILLFYQAFYFSISFYICICSMRFLE